MFRRKMFWALYGLCLVIFGLFFFGQYMLFWAETQFDQGSVRMLGRDMRPEQLIKFFRERLRLNGREINGLRGSGEIYRNFFWYQGNMVMIVLALAGSVLVGNDIRHRSLPFY